MYPVLFSYNGIIIYTYGLCIAAGGLFAFLYAHYSSKFELSKSLIPSLFILTMLASLIGGKLFLVFEEGNLTSLLSDFTSGHGFVFYGAAIACLIMWYVFSAYHRISYISVLDNVTYCGAIVLVFGKTGCLMAGCCFGKLCNSHVGVYFHHPLSAAIPLNQPLYPVQMLDILCAAVLFVWLHFSSMQQPGERFIKCIAGYSACRFVTEFFRGDEVRGYVVEKYLSNAQFVSLLFMLISLVIWLYNRTKLQNRNFTQ